MISLTERDGARKSFLAEGSKRGASGKKHKDVLLNFQDFYSIRFSIASPHQIRAWSYGEVRKPETINYRTFKPERDGLFCERIFGPVRDWECNCGKYKWVKHKGIVCDRCGVEVTESRVRRERMGHIELAIPVVHIWFLRKSPSRIATLLDMRISDVERVVYYANYLVLSAPPESRLRPGQLLTPEEHERSRHEFGDKLKTGIGAPVLKDLLKDLDLEKESRALNEALRKEPSEASRLRITKKLRIVDHFIRSGNKPEWMVLESVPVIPPELRPLVPLEGGRFATSDLNDLYRRIINRNNRLKIIEAQKAPEVMVHNEKRLLQEAVDALFENGARGRVVTGTGNRPLRSLSDVIKGKQGRFRQNLLGKRVDYSGRSVIVVGPNLKLHQCGLPKEMALELFKPFIIRELMRKGLAASLKQAKRMLERAKPEIWDILEQVTRRHPVMLNRAPTLHRLGIQAFEPVLIEGKAIQLHPLVCTAFNADFDGDQMAVHVPLSLEAQMEARVLMMASNNILSPSSGRPVVTPSQDMVVGCCYLTKPKRGVKGEGKIFSNCGEAVTAWQSGVTDLHARIKVRGVTSIAEDGLKNEARLNVDLWKDWTTIGRVLFNEILPLPLRFQNKTMSKKDMAELVERCFRELGHHETVTMLDAIKNIGYRCGTSAGLSISLEDMVVPKSKEELLKRARKAVREAEAQAADGIITDVERYNKVIDEWTKVTDQIADDMFTEMQKREGESAKPGEPKFNSIFMMADSGARGSRQQVRQLAGMRGLMAKPQKKITGQVGEIIETPVISNFREGLSVLEYFISTHGGRKGLADTALKTADAGYLTRRLVDVAHDVVVATQDCGTLNGIHVSELSAGDEVIESLKERVLGRYVLDNVAGILQDEKGELKEEMIVKAGEMIMREDSEKIVKAGITRLRIRSVLTCEAAWGVCAKCYGKNLATDRPVEIGEAVGIIAAQSIGEPGTQLTLRTFHIGGTASRMVKRSKMEAARGGMVRFHNIRTLKNKAGDTIVVSRNGEIFLKEAASREALQMKIPYGSKLFIGSDKRVEAAAVIAQWDPYTMPILTEVKGRVKLVDVIDGITLRETKNKITGQIERVIIEHRVEKLHPQIVISGEGGKRLASYSLPVDTHLNVMAQETVEVGDVIAKMPQQIAKTKDITGGLPRVAELFEARHPKNRCVISEIDGAVRISYNQKGQTVAEVESDTGMKREYAIPQGKHLVVYEGDRVGVGEPLTDGSVDPHDILRVLDAKGVQEHLVNEIQEVYRLQGVHINDKHIEAIVRQMLLNVRIEKSGDTRFLPGELVNRFVFEKENRRVEAEKGKAATAQPVLQGITKASLSSASFISAASFQETTRVLTDAAVAGAIDPLAGLKENVIIGHLIPAGTGMPAYRKIMDVPLAEKAEEKAATA